MRINNVIISVGKLLVPEADFGFTEETAEVNGKSYRVWEPKRSKLAAAISKGSQIELPESSSILYLGAAHGYTVSFLSQICTLGKIFAVEFAPRVARELVLVAEKTKNVLPIIADASQPFSYYHLAQPADIVFQDIAQRNQVDIFIRNCELFLRKNGVGMLVVKARSIDTTAQPSKIFVDVKRQLEQLYKVEDYRQLSPFQQDHAFFVVRKR
jgi:fibrillarin-like pre-rRNA processing protein